MMSLPTGRKALLERMREKIDAHAERIAVRAPEGCVTYGHFSRLVGRLCRQLRSPERPQLGPVGLTARPLGDGLCRHVGPPSPSVGRMFL